MRRSISSLLIVWIAACGTDPTCPDGSELDERRCIAIKASDAGTPDAVTPPDAAEELDEEEDATTDVVALEPCAHGYRDPLTAVCKECLEDAHCGEGQRCDGAACVGCIDDSDCGGSTPACDPETSECTGCFTDPQCAATPETPHCVRAQCVECVDSTQCGAGVCFENRCVECAGDEQCRGTTPECVASRCVECEDDYDCGSASEARCGADHACAPCASHGDCAHVEGRSTCSVGVCVECTEARASAECGGKSCNPVTHTCTSTALRSLANGAACVSNAECESNACGRHGMRVSGEIVCRRECVLAGTSDILCD